MVTKNIHSLTPTHLITADGSSTLVLPGLNEQYHSKKGAIQESKIVYIAHGFNYLKKTNLTILEIGLGTGLNCLLTYAAFIDNKEVISIDYTALEPFPIQNNLIDKLNYPALIEIENAEQVFQQIHACKPNEKVFLEKDFTFTYSNDSVQTYVPKNTNFDLIYFDAFGPAVQPEMWTSEIFEKMYALLNPNGVLVTYCAKGEVKRTLKSVGFKVEGLNGPPGKREVTRALKEV
jgi:tRNA U34 5-methylaminomethyl-2-thiouridine-forming methyltransferase MnmC